MNRIRSFLSRFFNIDLWGYGLFWSWNLIFLAFMMLGFAPNVIPETVNAIRRGLIPINPDLKMVQSQVRYILFCFGCVFSEMCSPLCFSKMCSPLRTGNLTSQQYKTKLTVNMFAYYRLYTGSNHL